MKKRFLYSCGVNIEEWLKAAKACAKNLNVVFKNFDSLEKIRKDIGKKDPEEVLVVSNEDRLKGVLSQLGEYNAANLGKFPLLALATTPGSPLFNAVSRRFTPVNNKDMMEESLDKWVGINTEKRKKHSPKQESSVTGSSQSMYKKKIPQIKGDNKSSYKIEKETREQNFLEERLKKIKDRFKTEKKNNQNLNVLIREYNQNSLEIVFNKNGKREVLMSISYHNEDQQNAFLKQMISGIIENPIRKAFFFEKNNISNDMTIDQMAQKIVESSKARKKVSKDANPEITSQLNEIQPTANLELRVTSN